MMSQNPIFSDLKSGVFLHGQTRQVIEEFLRGELADALRAVGAHVVLYSFPPGMQQISLDAVTAEIWSQLSAGTGERCPSLLADVVRAGTRSGNVLAILFDGIDRETPQKDHEAVFKALKAARDANNLWKGEHGTLLLVFSGTCKARLLELTTDRREAFYCASLLTIPSC